MSVDQVTLTIPAHASWVRLARLTVAGVASRMGFGVDDVEALRIGVDELAMLLIDDEHGVGDVTVVYRPDPAGLTVEGHRSRRANGTADAPIDQPVAIVAQILSTVVDDWSLDGEPDAARFRCSKRHEVLTS